MGLELVPLAGIVCGTSMITIIGVSVARALAKARSSAALQRDYASRINRLQENIESFEARIAEQETDIRRLQEDNRFLNKLLKDDRQDEP